MPFVTAQIDPATDIAWMRHALALAERAQREHDEIPVGAVLVGPDGRLIGEGYNRNTIDPDRGKPTNGEFIARLANVVNMQLKQAA